MTISKDNSEKMANAVELFGNANSVMIDALNEVGKQICCNKEIMFDNDIDATTSNPIFGMGYDKEDGLAYVLDVNDSRWDLDDLTGNELFVICNKIMANNWKYIK